MLRIFFGLLIAGVSSAALPSNGLNLIGFGAESSLMGGADVAVARDTTALNTNPAGLSHIRASALDLFGGNAYGSDVRHLHGFGNERNVSKRIIPVGGFGFAHLVYESVKPGAGGSVRLRPTPLHLLDGLAALMPPPRKHRHCHHGALAPYSPAPRGYRAGAVRRDCRRTDIDQADRAASDPVRAGTSPSGSLRLVAAAGAHL